MAGMERIREEGPGESGEPAERVLGDRQSGPRTAWRYLGRESGGEVWRIPMISRDPRPPEEAPDVMRDL